MPRYCHVTYTSALDGVFPARVYTAERGRERYAVTVADYTDAKRIHTERAKSCPPDAQSLSWGQTQTVLKAQGRQGVPGQ